MAEDEKTYHITQNHHILNSLFFNHDRNPPHHSALHTALILLSLTSEKGFHDEVCSDEAEEDTFLEKKLEIVGDDVLKQEGLVIAPGVLLQSLADNHIPPDKIITKVETRFMYPLLVPVDKGSKELKIRISEEVNPEGTFDYKIGFFSDDIYGAEVQIAEMSVKSVPYTIPIDKIYERFVKEHFEKLKRKKQEPIVSISHDTYISADDDDCYWRSIQGKNPFKRNGSISQLELLSKMPRILSMMADKIENDSPEGYQAPERDLSPFLRYAEKEKSYGRNNGKSVEERARELSKRLRTTYARQVIVFDPRMRLDIDQHFDLTTNLLGKIKRGMHTFISEAAVGDDTLFVDE